MNPLFGSMGPGAMGQMGNFNDFLKSRYESMLSGMPSKVVRSQEYMDKMDLYGEAYDKMGFGNPQPTLAPGIGALNPIPQDPGDIQKLIGGISPIDGFNPPAPGEPITRPLPNPLGKLIGKQQASVVFLTEARGQLRELADVQPT